MTSPTKSVRPTIANLAAGQIVRAGYSYHGDTSGVVKYRFIGFRYNDTWFSNLRDLKNFMGATTLASLEQAAERRGTESIHAGFKSEQGEYQWEAYLWNGAFQVGTSADRLVLRAA